MKVDILYSPIPVTDKPAVPPRWPEAMSGRPDTHLQTWSLRMFSVGQNPGLELPSAPQCPLRWRKQGAAVADTRPVLLSQVTRTRAWGRKVLTHSGGSASSPAVNTLLGNADFRERLSRNHLSAAHAAQSQKGNSEICLASKSGDLLSGRVERASPRSPETRTPGRLQAPRLTSLSLPFRVLKMTVTLP